MSEGTQQEAEALSVDGVGVAFVRKYAVGLALSCAYFGLLGLLVVNKPSLPPSYQQNQGSDASEYEYYAQHSTAAETTNVKTAKQPSERKDGRKNGTNQKARSSLIACVRDPVGCFDRHEGFFNVVNTTFIMLFTAALVWFTFALWRSSEKLWAVSKQSADAADEANRLNRLAQISSRGRVRVEVVEPGMRAESNGSIRLSGRFRYQCINSGTVQADLEEICTDFEITDMGFNPTAIPQTRRGRTLPQGIVATAETPYEEGENLIAVYDISVLYADEAWTTKLIWFYGFVIYSDSLGHRTKNGFCFNFDPIGNRWRRLLGDDYNYNKTVTNDALPPSP